MTLQEIEDIFKEKIAIIRKYSSLKPYKPDAGMPYDFNRAVKNIPPLNPVYQKTVQYRDMIKVHSDIDNKPIDLMRKRAPNEDDRQYIYRVNNFENVTMPYFMKALGKLNRIFNPSNYSIQWTTGQENEKKYFDEEIPVFGSLTSYFEEVVLTQKILDPNALLVIKPYFLPYKEDIDENGVVYYVLDDSEQITPIACVVDCDKVIDYKENVFAFIQLEEKSWVKVGDKEVKEGLIFEFYDETNIYRITQIGKKIDWQFTLPEIYYPHNLGYVPCWKLKGIPKQKEIHVLYQSYYIFAIPNLNIALYSHSNLDISLTTHMFPQKVEWIDRCPEPSCDKGKIRFEENGNWLSKDCPTCGGTGWNKKTGPMMTKYFTIPDQTQGDTDVESVPFPGMAFVAPNPDIPKFVHEKFMSDVETAFNFLNMDISNSDVKGGQPALSKQIDREELFVMLMRISNEVFSLFDKSMTAMGTLRYGSTFAKPVVSAPTSFSIRSEQDLLAELKDAKESGVPDVALGEIVKEYISKRYSNRANIHKIVNLAFAVDRLVVKIQEETDSMLMNNTASKLEVVLHDSIFTYIDQCMIEDEKFFDKDLKYQEEKLWAMAEETLSDIEDSKDKEAERSTNNILKISENGAA